MPKRGGDTGSRSAVRRAWQGPDWEARKMGARDKLMLELLAFSSHSDVVDLARYGFISIRYFL